jgi:hypothetical protein
MIIREVLFRYRNLKIKDYSNVALSTTAARPADFTAYSLRDIKQLREGKLQGLSAVEG